jgi:uncharacterized protein (DUF427 family)
MSKAKTLTRVPSSMERARLKDGAHIELSPRRVRTYFGGRLIADSERVLLVYESKRPPAYWFPIADVQMDLLTRKEPTSDSGPDIVRWRLKVGDRVAENGAHSFAFPSGDKAGLEDHVSFYWNEMDSWFEEDTEVFVHPRDPYTRVDVVESSRHVRIEIDGHAVADTTRPHLLYETGLPTRYYIPKMDVRMDLLEGSDSISKCPYKGSARYWSFQAVDKKYTDIVWSYSAPIPECTRIDNLLCFYNEKVDIYVDGKLQERPITPLS